MIYLFFTGGSGNRGCEAIVRGTKELLNNQKMVVYTAKLQEEQDSGLTNVVTCNPLTPKKTKLMCKVDYLLCGLSYHFGSGKLQVKRIYSEFLKHIKPEDTYLVIGGDVYCYDKPYIYYRTNEILNKSSKILWGCSIEPDSIDDEMKKDLLSYDWIYARESITYDGLIKHGIVENVKLFPDPAFVMKKKELPLPQGFVEGNTIGINVSPLIEERESISGITLKNCERLIEYIITETDCQIALIPHVIWENSDDRSKLCSLYDKFVDSGRVIMIDAVPAEQIKGYISKCRFMVAARTHASIASYSTCVPTLVVGYSVKARGIAKDLFGEYEHYTIPVQLLRDENDLLNAFVWMWEREDEIRTHLQNKIPEYIACMKEIPELVAHTKKMFRKKNEE